MIESVSATTIKIAQQGDLGIDKWVWLCGGILLLAVVVCILGMIIDEEVLVIGTALVALVAFVVWLGLMGTQESRSIDSLIDRQETALEEQHEYSNVQVNEDGDFVAADSDGQHVSGLLVEKDDTVFYVIIED